MPKKSPNDTLFFLFDEPVALAQDNLIANLGRKDRFVFIDNEYVGLLGLGDDMDKGDILQR